MSQDDKEALRRWLLERNPNLHHADLSDDTPLIERRYLTSLQVADLLVYLEELRGSPVDPGQLKPGVFRSIDSIHQAFLAC